MIADAALSRFALYRVYCRHWLLISLFIATIFSFSSCRTVRSCLSENFGFRHAAFPSRSPYITTLLRPLITPPHFRFRYDAFDTR